MSNERRGSIVPADDLEIGKYYIILGRRQCGHEIPIAGISFQIVAISLPFIVVQFAGYSLQKTIDTRYFDIMRTDEAFFNVQNCPRQTGESSGDNRYFFFWRCSKCGCDCDSLE